MNIETREVKDESELTPAERASGQWVKIPKTYKVKLSVSDADYARIMKADAKRKAKAAKRINRSA